jgi:hypothetical protein
VVVDQRVQRNTEPGKVERLTRDWDWMLAEVLTLTRRPDGTLVATEGQHRLLALQEIDPDIEMWAVLATDITGMADEAAAALGIARGRRQHNKVQEWRMRVTAQLPHELAAEQVLDEMGLVVTEGRGGKSIAAAGTLMRIIHGTGTRKLTPAEGADLLRKTLHVIMDSVPEEGQFAGRRFDSAILTAVASLIAGHQQINLNRLGSKLSQRTATQWLAFRRAASPAWRGVEEVIRADYNRALRAARLT